jgi:hypothetical protein
MRNSDRKPPILLRGLSRDRRIKMAGNVRDRAAEVGDWIAPELRPDRLVSTTAVGAWAALWAVVIVGLGLWLWEVHEGAILARPEFGEEAEAVSHD